MFIWTIGDVITAMFVLYFFAVFGVIFLQDRRSKRRRQRANSQPDL